MKKYLVIDVGGSSIKSALMSEDEILEKGERIPTPRDDLNAFIEAVGSRYDQYQGQIEGIAISAPGRIDCRRGHFYHGGALHCLNGIDLIPLLQKRCPVRITIENDGKCAALAELYKGTMQNVDNGMVVVIGTGIGAGLIINHHLYRGSHFSAGEIGMQPMHLEGPFAAGKGNVWVDATRAHTVMRMYERKMNLPVDSIGGVDFFRMMEAGNTEAQECFDVYCESVITGIIGLQYVLDLERIAFGGGFSNEPMLLEGLQKHLDQAYEKLDPAYAVPKPELVLCHYRADANLYGAVYHFMHTHTD